MRNTAKREMGGRLTVRLLRDQATRCACCGELFKAGDEMIAPYADAEALIVSGDAVLSPGSRQ
jgi:hypothetical protein